MSLSTRDIKAMLPHRFPMLQVDRVTELSPGRHIVAEKAVTGSEPCYAAVPDDAPQHAYAYPISLMLESLGQSGCLLWMQSLGRAAYEGRTALIFGSARGLRLTSRVLPGEVMRHQAWLTAVKGDTAILRGETTAAGRPVLTLESMVAVQRDVTLLA